jgi:hypothetical protein
METENNLVQDVKEEPIVESNEEKTPDAIPYSRFKEIVDDKNKYKTENYSLKEQIAKKEKDAEMKELENQGEYEKMISNITLDLENERKEKEEYKSKATAWDDYRANRKNDLLEKLPENERAIYDGLELDKLEAHVDKFNQKSNIPSVDTSESLTTGGYSSLTEASTDYKRGKLEKSAYEKIIKKFRSGIGR